MINLWKIQNVLVAEKKHHKDVQNARANGIALGNAS
jgi:hypothetical protein